MRSVDHLPELGALQERHRPVPLPVALGLSALVAVVPALPLLAGDPALWRWALLLAVVLSPFVVAVFAQSWFLEHRLHTGGLVLGNVVPLNATYVVPYDTMDPASVRTTPWQRAPGLAQPREIVSPLRRQALWPHRTVRFHGLDAKLARDLARGRVGWQQAHQLAAGPAPHLADPGHRQEWILSFAHADAVAPVLRTAAAQRGAAPGHP